MLSTITSIWYKKYRLAVTLNGHRDAVYSLAIADSAKYLASGGVFSCLFCASKNRDKLLGADGAKIWDLKTYKELRVPEQGRKHRGQVACMSWATLPSERQETLCLATGLGYLVLWEEHPEVRIDEM